MLYNQQRRRSQLRVRPIKQQKHFTISLISWCYMTLLSIVGLRLIAILKV